MLPSICQKDTKPPAFTCAEVPKHLQNCTILSPVPNSVRWGLTCTARITKHRDKDSHVHKKSFLAWCLLLLSACRISARKEDQHTLECVVSVRQSVCNRRRLSRLSTNMRLGVFILVTRRQNFDARVKKSVIGLDR